MFGAEYLNPAMLIGVGALAAPVIIHLIYRLRVRRVVFSTLRFLKVVTAENARRLRLRDLLLLILRAAALALLALAFARPFFPGGAVSGGPERESADVVYILDDTFSMTYHEGGRTRLEHARDAVRRRLGELRASDRAALVRVSEPAAPAVALTGNFGAVRSAAEATVPATGHHKLLPALTAAAKVLAESSARVRRIVIASDLQKTSWEPLAVEEAVSSGALEVGGIEIAVEGFDADGVNAAPVEVRPLSKVWMPSRPTVFGVRVANFSPRRMDDLVVKLVLRERVVAQKSVSVESGSSVALRLPARLDRAGEFSGRVELVTGDGLAVDDVRYFAASMPERLDVNIVQEEIKRHSRRYFDETYFLQKSLDPRTSREDEPAGPFTVRVVEGRKLTAGDLERVPVVILAGVQSLGERAAEDLEKYVSSGGGLLIFLGGTRRAGADLGADYLPDAKTYEVLLWNEGQGILPARPGRAVGKLGDPGRYFSVESVRESHPVFGIFAAEAHAAGGGGRSGLANVRIHKAFSLNQEDVSRREVSVLAQLDNGRPLIVEKPHGAGRVILVATSASADWSDLPKRKAYLPLVHQMVRYLASGGRAARREFDVDDLVSFTPPELPEGATVRVDDPDGSELAVGLEPARASVPGIYTARVTASGSEALRYAAVNLPLAESDLRSVRASEIASALSAPGTAEGEAAERQLRIDENSSRELKARAPYWRYLVFTVLGVLLLESLVSNVRLRKLRNGSSK